LKIVTAEFLKGVLSPRDLPDDYQEIAVVGRSNVGKSSFLNFLCNRKKLVSISRTPGKTRELNFFLINGQFYLVDIPGFGFAKVSKKEQMVISRRIEDYFCNSRKITGIIYLLDVRRLDSPVDRESIDWLSQFDVPMLMVAVKADKLKKNRINSALNALEREYSLPVPPLSVSSLKKTGREEILEQLDELLRER
jgi:GTP-binding protein